jgi:hypothetical protein
MNLNAYVEGVVGGIQWMNGGRANANHISLPFLLAIPV